MSALVDETSYKANKSLWTWKSSSTQRRQITTCSQLDTSVVSSTIIVKYDWLRIKSATLRSTCRAITLRGSFRISADVYLSLFLASHSISLESSSARRQSSWAKLELHSSPSPQRARPDLASNQILDNCLRKHRCCSNFLCLLAHKNSADLSWWQGVSEF